MASVAIEVDDRVFEALGGTDAAPTADAVAVAGILRYDIDQTSQRIGELAQAAGPLDSVEVARLTHRIQMYATACRELEF